MHTGVILETVEDVDEVILLCYEREWRNPYPRSALIHMLTVVKSFYGDRGEARGVLTYEGKNGVIDIDVTRRSSAMERGYITMGAIRESQEYNDG
jgi:hypothetical protein